MLAFTAVLLLSGFVRASNEFGPSHGKTIQSRQTAPSNATCTKATWTFNSRGQSPCQVLQDLGAKCIPDFTVQPITHAIAPYVLPSGNFNNDCLCNVVAYNLIAACSWCQTGILIGDWVTESRWRSVCTNYYTSGIPPSVPFTSLSIPEWAYLPNTGSAWIASQASLEAKLGLPDLTAPGSPTSTGKSSTTRAGSVTSRPSGGSIPNYTTTYVNVVAIAVGVVFGLYALIFIIGLTVYFVRQKSRQAWYRPMAEHYRRGGLPPWQSAGGFSEQGPLLAANSSPYQASTVLPNSPGPYSGGSHYSPSPAPYFDPQQQYAQPQYNPQQYNPPQQQYNTQPYNPQQYQQPPQSHQDQQYSQNFGHAPGYTGAPQIG